MQLNSTIVSTLSEASRLLEPDYSPNVTCVMLVTMSRMCSMYSTINKYTHPWVRILYWECAQQLTFEACPATQRRQPRARHSP
eukprot:scaffold272893_cov21-Tisochrysis_lutea.AAC.3